MDELWVDIKGYENKYQVSNMGRIKSVKQQLVMKPMVCTNGYLSACLWKNNKQRKFLIHRLVALHFIDNPNNYSDVNHIDEDKTNNCVGNLHWCSHLFNMNYGNVRLKISESNKGKKLSSKTLAKLRTNSVGRIWIHNGETEKLIYPYQLKFYFDRNWNKGRIKKGA